MFEPDMQHSRTGEEAVQRHYTLGKQDHPPGLGAIQKVTGNVQNCKNSMVSIILESIGLYLGSMSA